MEPILFIILIISIIGNILLIVDRKILTSLSSKLVEGLVKTSKLNDTLQKSVVNLNTILLDNAKLRTQVSDLLDVLPGDRVLTEASLTHTDSNNNNKKTSFQVTYECEVLEIRKNCEIIIDQRQRRDSKLEDLLQ